MGITETSGMEMQSPQPLQSIRQRNIDKNSNPPHTPADIDDATPKPWKSTHGHSRSRHRITDLEQATQNNDGQIERNGKSPCSDAYSLQAGIESPSALIQRIESILRLPYILIFQCTKTSRNLVKILLLGSDGILIGRPTLGQQDQPATSNGLFSDRILSRKHAKLYLRNDRVYIQDIGSSNGTFIFGTRLSPEGKESELVPLSSGQLIDFGQDMIPGSSVPKLTISIHFSGFDKEPKSEAFVSNISRDVYDSVIYDELLSIESTLDRCIAVSLRKKGEQLDTATPKIPSEPDEAQDEMRMPDKTVKASNVPDAVINQTLPSDLHVKKFRAITTMHQDIPTSDDTVNSIKSKQPKFRWIIALLASFVAIGIGLFALRYPVYHILRGVLTEE